ncbi:MAG TPA: hypothetical protein DHW14_02350 [Clostridiales bacterium]|nr:hypothetical protein [Clostridiales bacterium]
MAHSGQGRPHGSGCRRDKGNAQPQRRRGGKRRAPPGRGGYGRRARPLSRYAGCLLGTAVGDALGAPTEFLPLAGHNRAFRTRGRAGARAVAGSSGRQLHRRHPDDPGHGQRAPRRGRERPRRRPRDGRACRLRRVPPMARPPGRPLPPPGPRPDVPQRPP